MKAWFACLALALPLCAAAADDPALAALDACRAKLNPRTDVGLERIERRCPDLMRTLEKAPWYGLVPPDLRARRDELSAEGLRALGELVRGANRELAERQAPDVEALAPVLAELGEQGKQGATRWERFKRWLQRGFERREKRDDRDSWLQRMGRQFETSEGVARFITYTGYVLLGALVLLVIFSELRAAGFLGGRRREGSITTVSLGKRRRLRLEDVAQAPLAERPGLLLRLLGDALTRADRLPAAQGLTASVIARTARLDDPADRASLEAVAMAAESVRYGARPPSDDSLERAANSATALLSRLSRTPARQGSRG